MSNYKIVAGSGVSIDADSKTLTGAKREATEWINYGGGDVAIYLDGNQICLRRFWQSGNRFGWHKWERC